MDNPQFNNKDYYYELKIIYLLLLISWKAAVSLRFVLQAK